MLKNMDYEKVHRKLLEIYGEQEGIKIATTVIKKEGNKWLDIKEK